jgi:hypothetical protein
MFEIVDGSLHFNGTVSTLDEAFEASIKKWETLRDYYLGNPGQTIGDGGSQTCGLCRLFWLENCEGCPIAEAGHEGCAGTAYVDYCNEIEFLDVDCNRIVEICESEIEFLNQIRSK